MNRYSILKKAWKRWFWCFLPLVSLLFTLTVHSAPVTRYIHTDPMGSPIAATDENGEILWVEDYKPFGERIRREDKSAPHKRWYTGHVQDEDTGLIYMGARYYDPEIGRFLSPDPVGFDPENPVSFNKYAYANNNPYRYVDPDGRAAFVATTLVTLSVSTMLMHSDYANAPAPGQAERSLSSYNHLLSLASFAPAKYGGAYVDDLIRFGTNKKARDSLPRNPDELLKRGYRETSHPSAAKKGHRNFENPKTGDKVRYDPARMGQDGKMNQAGYHRYNPKSTGRHDLYLDKCGNPCRRGSVESHLNPGD